MKSTLIKRFLLCFFGFACVMGVAFSFGLFLNPFKLLNSGAHSAPTVHKNPALKKIYDVNFIMDTQPSGDTNIFLPKLTLTDPEHAAYFSEFFGVTEHFSETDEHYAYANALGNLYIDKFGQHLRFEAVAKPAAKTAAQTRTDAVIIQKASDFAKAHSEYFSYEDAEITYSSGTYDLYFIERLGNLKNYAFSTHFTLSANGEILTMDYCYPVYEKLASVPLKSMDDAFWELPAALDGLPAGAKVDLKKCTLVYSYLDSVVQPCYLFEGEIPPAGSTAKRQTENKSFRCFVRAAAFE